MTESEEQPRPMNPLVPWFSLAGVALLLAGAFCPVLQLPGGAAQNYRDFQTTDGNIVIGLVAVSFVLTWVFRWHRGLFVTGALAFFMIGATFLRVLRAGGEEVALLWGWLPLVAGATLLLAAASVAEMERRRQEQEKPLPSDDELVNN
jgi:hypothetical protein